MAAKKERPAPAKAPKTAKPAEAGKAGIKSTISSNARAEMSPDELRKLVSEAAYYRAKQRGFTPGHEMEDWIQAEAEVLQQKKLPAHQ